MRFLIPLETLDLNSLEKAVPSLVCVRYALIASQIKKPIFSITGHANASAAVLLVSILTNAVPRTLYTHAIISAPPRSTVSLRRGFMGISIKSLSSISFHSCFSV